MAYAVTLDGVMLPVTPEQIQFKIKNQNKTVNLINDGEANIIKQAGLTDITFKALLPNVKYPFARYAGRFRGAEHYLGLLEKLKTQTSPFQFRIDRELPGGEKLYGNDVTVTLEDYKTTESAKNGFDVVADIALKQYRAYATKIVEIKPASPGQPAPAAYIGETRPGGDAPQAASHAVVSGDSLWAIAKKYLDDGNRYPEIYSLNQAAIDAGNEGTGNSKYTIHPGQELAIPT